MTDSPEMEKGGQELSALKPESAQDATIGLWKWFLDRYAAPNHWLSS